MNRTYHTLSTVHAGLAALALLIASPLSWADDDDEEEIPFDEHEIFFELNNTDGDLGIHALIDGDGWKRLSIEDPNERKILNVRVKGRLRRQGLTEIFFESAEPTFDELPPAVFFERFDEGIYDIDGLRLDGMELSSETELTHVMPNRPAAMVNGILFADQCNDELPGHNPTELMDPPEVTISWPDVTMSHSDPLGGGASVQTPVPVTIENYEVVVEVESENPDDETETYEAVFSARLPHWVNSLTIPEEIINQGDEFKYEVLAREESFNQTAVESCFVLVEME